MLGDLRYSSSNVLFMASPNLPLEIFPSSQIPFILLLFELLSVVLRNSFSKLFFKFDRIHSICDLIDLLAASFHNCVTIS